MEKSEAIKFLLDNTEAAEFFSNIEEDIFFGERLETRNNTMYWDKLTESSKINKEEPKIYDISSFEDEDVENLLKAAENITESLRKGFNLAYTEKHPSVKCGDCSSKWIQQKAGHISLATGPDNSSKSSYKCHNCGENNSNRTLVYFDEINLAVAENLEIYQTF